MASKRPDEMTEEELARFYEERKGDLSLWAKTPRPIRRRRGGPSTVFAVRFTPTELESLQAAAEQLGTTTSDFIRTAALRAATGSDDSAVSARLLSEAVEQAQQSVASLRKAARKAEEAARPKRSA